MNTEKHFKELQKEQRNWLQEDTYIYSTVVYTAVYQCCKRKMQGPCSLLKNKKVNLNFIWIRCRHPITFLLNSAECTRRCFISQLFFFNADYANTPWQEAKAADTDIPYPTLHISTSLYLQIILTRLKQEHEFGRFQHLRLRGRSILGPWAHGSALPWAAAWPCSPLCEEQYPPAPSTAARRRLHNPKQGCRRGAREGCWTSLSDGLSGERKGLLPGKGWMHLATGLGTGSRGGGSRAAHPTERRLHRLRALRSPRGRSYLGPLAAGAADVVAHPGRLVHAEAGGRAGKLGSAPAETREEGAGGLAGWPRTGILPRPPGSARWRRSGLPGSKSKPETPPPHTVPSSAFPPPPSKAEARRARFCPPPPSGAAAAAGRAGPAPHASPRAHGPRCSALSHAAAAPQPGPASPPAPRPLQRARGALTSSALFCLFVGNCVEKLPGFPPGLFFDSLVLGIVIPAVSSEINVWLCFDWQVFTDYWAAGFGSYFFS